MIYLYYALKKTYNAVCQNYTDLCVSLNIYYDLIKIDFSQNT